MGLPYNYRILKINHKKELLRGLWVGIRVQGSGFCRDAYVAVSGLGLAFGGAYELCRVLRKLRVDP